MAPPFALQVMRRQSVSGSDRACDSWLEGYRVEGIEGLDLHHFYRAMAWLGEELADQSGRMNWERAGVMYRTSPGFVRSAPKRGRWLPRLPESSRWAGWAAISRSPSYVRAYACEVEQENPAHPAHPAHPAQPAPKPPRTA